MHLLNVDTRKLEDFVGDSMPHYAILSHTWGQEEVLFQDLDGPKHKEKLGYAKIEGCCQQAIRDSFKYVWIDTCCIDKRSSAELSEAINSMFAWYGKADVCYVYLEDVPREEHPHNPGSAFCRSRWFTRGWTLQELIAPTKLIFFDKSWDMIFDVEKGWSGRWNSGGWESGGPGNGKLSKRAAVIDTVRRVTGIESWDEYSMHLRENFKHVPVATKFSWISRRSTSRVEDMAYSLLGLLDMSMPLLYGEGHRAFIRLQEEFLKRYFDPSILLWGVGMDSLTVSKLGGGIESYGLAQTPLLFEWARHVRIKKSEIHRGQSSGGTWALTPQGLRVGLPLLCIDGSTDSYLCVISYTVPRKGRNGVKYFAMPLQRSNGSDVYIYTDFHRPVLLEMPIRWFKQNISKWKTIYLMADQRGRRVLFDLSYIRVSPLLTGTLADIQLLSQYGFQIDSIYPPAYDSSSKNIPSRWIHYTFGRHAVIVMHRDQTETLYLLMRYSKWGKEYKALISRSSYSNRRSAIEVWDSCRGPWRIFSNSPRLDWEQATNTYDHSPLGETSPLAKHPVAKQLGTETIGPIT